MTYPIIHHAKAPESMITAALPCRAGSEPARGEGAPASDLEGRPREAPLVGRVRVLQV